MKRGDIFTVVLSGDYGKPRPAIIVQSDTYDILESITVIPLTSQIFPGRLPRVSIETSAENNLTIRSQAMIDKINSIPKVKASQFIGRLSSADMASVDRALALFLGFA